MEIAILDYGASNIYSLICAFKRLNVSVNVASNEIKLTNYNAIVLPGVGNFIKASSIINHIKDELLKVVNEGIPVLGICLGLQILFEKSEEGDGQGLGILKGKVVRFPKNVKAPHMGWNIIYPNGETILLSNIESKIWAYFAHSYYPLPENSEIIKGITHYGIMFPSVIEKENLFGTQFHPEKSGIIGRKILENFLYFIKR